MATTIALYRFWPDVAAGLDSLLAAWPESGRMTWARLGGTFDLAVAFESPEDLSVRGTRALWLKVAPWWSCSAVGYEYSKTIPSTPPPYCTPAVLARWS